MCHLTVHRMRGPSCDCGHIVDGAQLWALHATRGFPIELSIPLLAAQGYVASWDALLEAAKRDGANMDRLTDRLCEAVADAYPHPIATVIVPRLRAWQN